ncbi:MAG TPA: hypothetical protein VLU47_01465, partial [Blastocatellia bacterium]|nr:hypothetical protein [Blastocatellia bacterium]
RKEFADTIAAKEQAEKELQALRAQLEASRSSDRASVDQSQKELQAAKAAQVKAEQDANYWKDQAAKKRASSEQSDDIRVAKLQKDLQSVNAAKDNAVKEVNHWKDQVAKLQREIQASKKTAPGSAKPSGEIASHLAAARKYREGGAYDSALAELRAASTLYPANEEIAAEIDKTKRACNAEKRLGRTDLKC